MAALLVGLGSFLLFLFFQSTGIYGGDSGDLVTAAYEFGVPHPPGYPLYAFLTWLATRIPLSTPAWRVGLMSSAPHALTLVFVYLLTRRLAKSVVAGLFATLMLAGNYLFFLYSVTPEVFALFDLFVILAISLLLLWDEMGSSRYLYFFSFVFGLSLTHHHVILFLVPAIGYFMWRKIRSPKKTFHFSHLDDAQCKLFTFYFFLGLLPYLYIPMAARGGAIVNWDRAVDWKGFVHLVTRQDYGSFVASGFYGALPVHRLLQLKAYGQFVLLDLTWAGVAMAIVGFVFLWKRQKRSFWLLFLSLLFIGPGFFFYASFPLMNRFSLGTYERFLLPSYTILAVVMGLGWGQLVKFGKWGKLAVLLFLVPLIVGAVTVWRFWGLPNDQTADHLGQDILTSLAPHAIVLLSRDTPLFITQYVRYPKGVRPDVTLLHANRLWSADYPATIARRYPALVVPESERGKFALALVRANRDMFPVYTNTAFPLDDGWFWVQEGLVYRLTPRDTLPELQEFIDENDLIWYSFHDPRRGILSRYAHLMLSDVLSVYADARISIGKTILRGGNTVDAKRYFREAVAYKSDIEEQDGYTYLGLAELFDNHCSEALSAFAKAREASLVPDVSLTLYESVAYRDACGDAQKARELMNAYEKARQERDIPLQ